MGEDCLVLVAVATEHTRIVTAFQALAEQFDAESEEADDWAEACVWIAAASRIRRVCDEVSS